MKNQDDSITATRSQIEQVYITWVNENKENPENFQSINVEEMTTEEIEQYAKDCTDYLFAKLNES
jgi:hypothetical protein